MTWAVPRHDSEEATEGETTEGETTEGKTTVNSPKRLAGIAGLLYLVVAIFGGFAQGFVYPKVYAAGDAMTTAKNLLANSGLVRIGVVADLIQATVWVFVAMTLYLLLKHAHKDAARAMVAFAAMGAGITALGILLVVGAACYLVDMFAAFLVPDFGKTIHAFITIPSAIAEVWMVVYLLLIGVGVRTVEPERVLSAP